MSDRQRTRRAAPPEDPSPPKASAPKASPGAPQTRPLDLSLRIQARRWREIADLRPRIEAAIAAGLAVAPVKPLPGAELSLLLTDDKRIRVVNRDWRGFDKATNVLSFPAAPRERIAQSPALGDIVLALETLEREAADEHKALSDHLSHLVIHGLLHLLGEDHETSDDAQRMEALEVAALARLSIADPYADTDPVDAGASASKRTPAP